MRSHCLVGVAGPLSGPLADYGKLLVSATGLRSCSELEWVLRDDKASVEDAVAIAKEFVTLGTMVVVGHFNSSCSIEAARIYRRAEIPYVAPLTSINALLAHGGDWVLRPYGCNLSQAKKITECLDALQIDRGRVRVLEDGTAYAADLVDSLLSIGLTSFKGDRPKACVVLGKLHWAKELMLRPEVFGAGAVVIFADDCFMPSMCEFAGGVSSTLVCMGSRWSAEELVTASIGQVADAIAHAPITSRAALYSDLEERFKGRTGPGEFWSAYWVNREGFKLWF